MMVHFYFAKFMTTSQVSGAMPLDYSTGIAPLDRPYNLTAPIRNSIMLCLWVGLEKNSKARSYTKKATNL